MVLNFKKNKVRIEANLGANNLWKAVKIAQQKIQPTYLEQMQHKNEQPLRSNQEKADAFAEFFSAKTEEIVSKTKIEGDEVYNGKEKIF